MDCHREERDAARASREHLVETRRLWGQRYGRPITDDEAREIIDNMVAFAEIVVDWYMEERRKDKSPEDPGDAR